MKASSHKRLRCWLIAAALTSFATPSLATYRTTIEGGKHQRSDAWAQALPYAFYSDSLDWSVGVGGGASGHIQPNLTFIGTLMATANNSAMGYLYAGDYQLPFANRIFIDGSLYQANYTKHKQYINGNPDFPDERAGSNDSSIDNVLVTHSRIKEYQMRFRYLLPIGHGAGEPIHHYRTRNGEVVAGYESGGKTWNPMKTGRTFIQLEPYYWKQDVGEYNQQQPSNLSVGLRLELEYDNRDYVHNPTEGSRTRLQYTKDWGDEQRASWQMWQLRYSKYLSLGATDWAQQRVFAFGFGTSDTPGWNEQTTIDGQHVFHRPAWFAGSTLGGMDRLKGYESARFHDRASIYYSFEYRFTPHWNPLPGIPIVNWYNTPAWYWVAFVELGRVAGEYKLATLHEDMKYSVGGSMRATIESVVVRVDFASSGEDNILRLGVNHPF